MIFDFIKLIYKNKYKKFYMKYLKKFESFSAASPVVQPGVDVPTKPKKPTRPSKPIEEPSVNPEPKAEKTKKTTARDVANRFIEEVNKKGESVKKYLKK